MGGRGPRDASRGRGVTPLSREQHPPNSARLPWRARVDSIAASIWTPVVCWSVVVLELLAWAAMRMGDAMVIPTLLVYGARWVWLLPVVALAPLSLWRRSVVLPLAVAFSVGLLGVMQFQWPHLAPTETCCRLTIVTLNGNQVARPGTFSRLVEDSGADILAMQEWEQETAGPIPTGWRVHCEGELCVASRHGIQKIDVMYPAAVRLVALW